MKLTAHFQLSEFTRSATASARKIDNSLNPSNPHDAEVISNLTHLCEKVLEPLCQWYGKPIVIGSGYRCPALNKAVGGVSNSQHMKGEAADLHIPTIKAPNPSTGSGQATIQDMATARLWIEHLLEFGRFDQLILEHDKSGHYWIHVSLKLDDSKNRQLYIPNLLKK